MTDGAERLERGGAGDLAGAVAAHAVGDRDETHRVVDEVAVLVALAHAADVGGGADDEPHRPPCSRVTMASATVWPNCTWSPRRSLRACPARLAVEQRAVARAEVLDVDVAVAPEDARVHLSTRRSSSSTMPQPPPRPTVSSSVHGERLAAARRGLEDAETAGPATRVPARSAGAGRGGLRDAAAAAPAPGPASRSRPPARRGTGTGRAAPGSRTSGW